MFPHAVQLDMTVGCEASSLDKLSMQAWCGPQVDTLLRTAYELQDGLSRSAGHGRKPLPSPEQARLMSHSCLALTQLLTLRKSNEYNYEWAREQCKAKQLVDCCAAPATTASCCPTQASMPRSPCSLWSHKVRAALLALREMLRLGRSVGTRARNHFWVVRKVAMCVCWRFLKSQKGPGGR